MRRKLNIRLVLWTGAVVVVFGGLVHLLHGFQVSRNAESLLVQAERALKQGHTAQALRHFGHYLSYRPDDTATRARYALLLDKIPSVDPYQIVLAMEEVLRRDPSRKDIEFRLVHQLIYVDRLADAIVHLEKLLTAWDNQAEIEHMLGWCCESRGEYQRAAEWFRKAIASDPKRLESYTLLAEVVENRLDDTEQARKVIDAMTSANPESTRALLLHSQFLEKRGFLEEGAADLARAAELAPQDADVILARAAWAQKQLHFDEARRLLKNGLELYPRSELFFLALAGLEMRAGHADRALAIARKGLREAPTSAELRAVLIDLLLDDGALSEGRAELALLGKQTPDSVLVKFFEARLAIANKAYHDALELLEEVRRDLVPTSERANRVHALLGLCYQHLGETEQELRSYRQAALLDPGWTPAVIGLGSALLRAGRLEDALQELRQAAKNPDAPPALWTEIARAVLAKNLRLPAEQRNWDEFHRALAEAEQKSPHQPELAILRAEMLAQQRQFAEAEKLLGAIEPQNQVLACAIADLAAQQKNFSRARALLTQAKKNWGNSVLLRQTQLRLALSLPGLDKMRAIEEVGENLQDLSKSNRARLLRELADTWMRLGQKARAVATLTRLAAEFPRDVRSRFQLADLAIQDGRLDDARRLLGEVQKLDGPKSVLWRFGQAALLVHEANGDAAKLGQARQLLDSLHAQQPDWQRLPLLEARIDELQGKLESAITHYQAAFNLGERNPALVRRLVQLLQERRRFPEAERVLRNLEEEELLPADLLRLAAEIALGNQNRLRALRLAEKAVPEDSRDYRDYLWLADIYLQAEKLQAAETLLRQAIQLAPHTPDTWIALIGHLARTEQRAAAAIILAEAERKMPAQRLSYTLARCHDLLGQPNQAEKWFRLALAERPDDFLLLASAADYLLRCDEPAKAEPLLRRLLLPATATPGELLADARRQLALLLAVRDPQSQEALALVEANLQMRGPNVHDQRTRALVLGQHPARRAQTLQQFAATLTDQPVTPLEQFWYAKLWEAEENLVQSRNLLLELLATQPDNPQFLAYYIDTLLRDGLTADALSYLHKLQRREPDSPRTRALAAKIARAD